MLNISPFVSVIIPNYNHARYLEQRISTVLNQTYQYFEVIILDDCSTDNSLEIINRYKDNPHVSRIVVNDQNTGSPFKQWDKGISLAKGELVWIAESDDYCDIGFLNQLVSAYVKKKGTVLSYAPPVFVDGEGEIRGTYSKEGREIHCSGTSFIKRYLTWDNGVQNASCAIFSREVALQVIKDCLNYRGIGDWWFWLFIAQRGNVAIVNRHLSYFRRHGDNVTNKLTQNGTNARDIKVLLDYIFKHYYIPDWKKIYLLKNHRTCYRSVEYISESVKRDIYELWNVEQGYTKFQDLYCRVLNHLQRRYLIRL